MIGNYGDVPMSMSMNYSFSLLILMVLLSVGSIRVNAEGAYQSHTLQNQLENMARISTSDGWFEVIKLPNDVFAFHEPGHSEKVNSFLILGEKKDLLYDTGMGIASIKTAITEVRKAEGLPERELMVLNSHAHLDHIGGNSEFEKIHVFEHEWTVRKLTEGIPEGSELWVEYYRALTPPPNPPSGFSPETMSVNPISRENIRYIHHGDVIDLGNRTFSVILSKSHTVDSLILYDAENKLLFTGDAFVPAAFYVSDIEELHKDMEMLSGLTVDYHYNTHGPQLLDPELRLDVLRAAEKISHQEVEAQEIEFFGGKREVYEVDGFMFLYMPDFLMY